MINSTVARVSGDPKSAARKPKTKAMALGQVFTPPALAQTILRGLGIERAPSGARLLDPCVGPATFSVALAALGVSHVAVHAHDVDPTMVDSTRAWAAEHRLDIKVELGDYLESTAEGSYDFAVLNPPYVRQEWIERKELYRESFRKRYGVNVPGTSNLYIYFIVKTLADLKEGGRMACIVYDSWQSTRFGRWLQDHLSSSCRSVVVESVPNLPFEGRLIDATIIFAEKGHGNEVIQVLQQSNDFTAQLPGVRQIEQLFHTKRGLRLKQADFFMTDFSAIDHDGASLFVKKINLIPGYVVPADHPEAALLLTPTLRDARTVSALERRLADAHLDPEANVSILTWWRERPTAWANHTAAPWAPLLFNYYLRRRPRHIYNQDRFFSDNFYGLTPREEKVPVLAWLAALNSTLSVVGVFERARNQGAGLAKIQLFEYREARIVDLQQWSFQDIAKMEGFGQALVSGDNPQNVIASVDELIAAVLDSRDLRSDSLSQVLADTDYRARRPRD